MKKTLYYAKKSIVPILVASSMFYGCQTRNSSTAVSARSQTIDSLFLASQDHLASVRKNARAYLTDGTLSHEEYGSLVNQLHQLNNSVTAASNELYLARKDKSSTHYMWQQIGGILGVLGVGTLAVFGYIAAKNSSDRAYHMFMKERRSNAFKAGQDFEKHWRS